MERIEIKITLFLVLLTLILVAIFGFNPKKSVETIVTDPSEFYMVSGCIEKYYTYLVSSDSNKLFTILDSEYVKKQGITVDNVKEKLGATSNLYTYGPVKMYKQSLSKNVTRYYVDGYKELQLMDTDSEKIREQFTITLYRKNSTFSVMPYSGTLFK